MSRFLPDTSCIVASVCSWHEHHQQAAGEIERRLNRGDTLVVAAPALVESYAVLTRLPPPHRLSAVDAHRLLEANFMSSAVETVALEAEEYLRLLARAVAADVVGGRLYDAVIHACGLAANVEVLLTFNERQFRSLGGSIDIVVPM